MWIDRYIMGKESAGLDDKFDMAVKDDPWIYGLHHLIKEETLKEDQIWRPWMFC